MNVKRLITSLAVLAIACFLLGCPVGLKSEDRKRVDRMNEELQRLNTNIEDLKQQSAQIPSIFERLAKAAEEFVHEAKAFNEKFGGHTEQ